MFELVAATFPQPLPDVSSLAMQQFQQQYLVSVSSKINALLLFQELLLPLVFMFELITSTFPQLPSGCLFLGHAANPATVLSVREFHGQLTLFCCFRSYCPWFSCLSSRLPPFPSPSPMSPPRPCSSFSSSTVCP